MDTLRARRVHRADSREVLSRGDARDRVAGLASIPAAAISWCATWTKRASCATISRAAGPARTSVSRFAHCRVARIRSGPRSARASASRTRRPCWHASRWPSARKSARRMARAHGEEYRAEQLPDVRHHLQRDAGPAGRGRGAAARAARRDAGDRRLQLEQHASRWRRSARRRCATYHVEDAECLDVEPRRDPPPADRRIGGNRDAGLAAGAGPVRVGITAGASTPNNKIGEAVARVFATRGIDPGEIV